MKSINDIGGVMTALVRRVENQAGSLETATFGGERGRNRMPTPEAYGAKRSFSDLRTLFPQLIRIFRGIFGCWLRYKFVRQARRSSASAELLRGLEEHALAIGATAIGYAKITPDLVFKDFVVPHQGAIVILTEMRRDPFNTAPSLRAMGEVAKAYADTTSISNQLTSYLRRRGYSAFSGISIGGSVDHTRLAERAGLGKIGYHGSLISPQEGARVRINVVYTDIDNLPYPEVNSHDWVLDFCAKCRKCIRKCPPSAILSDPKPDSAGRLSVIQGERCGPYMAANFGCGVCIAVCPFSNAGYDKIRQGFTRAQK